MNKSVFALVNSITNNEISDLSQLKAFADNKINVTQILNFDLGRVKNIVGKREKADYQHFLLFPQCLQKGFFFFRVVNTCDCTVTS